MYYTTKKQQRIREHQIKEYLLSVLPKEDIGVWMRSILSHDGNSIDWEHALNMFLRINPYGKADFVVDEFSNLTNEETEKIKKETQNKQNVFTYPDPQGNGDTRYAFINHQYKIMTTSVATENKLMLYKEEDLIRFDKFALRKMRERYNKFFK